MASKHIHALIICGTRISKFYWLTCWWCGASGFVLRFCTSSIINQRIDISTWPEERLTLGSMSYTVLVTEECKAHACILKFCGKVMYMILTSIIGFHDWTITWQRYGGTNLNQDMKSRDQLSQIVLLVAFAHLFPRTPPPPRPCLRSVPLLPASYFCRKRRRRIDFNTANADMSKAVSTCHPDHYLRAERHFRNSTIMGAVESPRTVSSEK